MRYFEKLRIEFIERFVEENGHINRSDIMNEFGISLPQSSNDLQKYISLNPDSLSYNTKSKRYEKTKKTKKRVRKK